MGFVHFDNAHQLAKFFIGQSGAHPMAHVPSRPVRAEAHHPVHLKGADALLAGQHHVTSCITLQEVTKSNSAKVAAKNQAKPRSFGTSRCFVGPTNRDFVRSFIRDFIREAVAAWSPVDTNLGKMLVR
jgi:hypothetical protein